MANSDEELVRSVIAKYGKTLDLVNRPDELIEIVRNARFDDLDAAANPCAGAPPPPPGPTSMQDDRFELVDIMKEVFNLAKSVDQNTQELKALKKKLG